MTSAESFVINPYNSLEEVGMARDAIQVECPALKEQWQTNAFAYIVNHALIIFNKANNLNIQNIQDLFNKLRSLHMGHTIFFDILKSIKEKDSLYEIYKACLTYKDNRSINNREIKRISSEEIEDATIFYSTIYDLMNETKINECSI